MVKKRSNQKNKNEIIHNTVDIRNYKKITHIFFKYKKIKCIIHAAAQPSYDWAYKDPTPDFDVNAKATLHLLE